MKPLPARSLRGGGWVRCGSLFCESLKLLGLDFSGPYLKKFGPIQTMLHKDARDLSPSHRTQQRPKGVLILVVMGSKKCEVCKEAQSKYKCPSCLVPYCSLTCFKKHKEIPCKQSAPPVEELPIVVLPKRSQEVDDPSCVLNNKQLQSIADSNEIRSFLEDVNLQKLIRQIDSCKDPENELDKAMEGPVFRQFTEKVLFIVNPQE